MRSALFMICLLASGVSAQQRPVTGCERTELTSIDQVMVAFMDEHDVTGATLAIALDGEVLYERGFGWKDEARSVPMPPDALMRLASVSKPLTVSAVRHQIAQGLYTLDSFAFDLGQSGGGLLDLEPFPTLGDPRLADITVAHLIQHRGGWDRDIAGDLTYRETLVASDMSVPSPPGRELTLRWILGRPLEYTPGQTYAYSNIGGLALGLIVEQFAGMPLAAYLDEVKLGPLGIASEDHQQGRTFVTDQDPREPWYESTGLSVNVFDPAGPFVERPYGSWDHEARIGQGGQIATARALAVFAANHWVNGTSIGLPKSPTLHGTWRWNHTGNLDGSSSLIRQRGDGITYGVIMNKRSLGSTIRGELDPVLDQIQAWPPDEPNCCPGDADGDDLVNFNDLNLLLDSWGQTVPAGSNGDVSGDSTVNFADLNLVLDEWGAGC